MKKLSQSRCSNCGSTHITYLTSYRKAAMWVHQGIRSDTDLFLYCLDCKYRDEKREE